MDTIKLTNSSRLFMIFSAISLSKRKWKRELKPSDPAIIIYPSLHTVVSTKNMEGAVNSDTDESYELIKSIAREISKS